jgi:hypothetical protein
LDIRTSSLSSLKQASRYGSHEGERLSRRCRDPQVRNL